MNVWKIKHENTAWHSNVDDDDDFDIPDMDDLRGASHDAYLMNQRITSETFRYKFLNYNRSWLVNQLPSMLTPRTLKRSRPYLINQFSRILNQLNRDISSDSEDDSPDFGPVALTATSRKIIRWWLAKARKQVSGSETHVGTDVGLSRGYTTETNRVSLRALALPSLCHNFSARLFYAFSVLSAVYDLFHLT